MRQVMNPAEFKTKSGGENVVGPPSGGGACILAWGTSGILPDAKKEELRGRMPHWARKMRALQMEGLNS